MSDLYRAGAMDRWIRVALDRAAVVRDIYARVANVNHPADWHPAPGDLRVVRQDRHDDRHRLGCRARPRSVRVPHRPRPLGDRLRALGGEISPFGGRAKLPFNVDWAAKWSAFGVTIEPNGKDLGTRGGARDRSEAIAREVFDREPPLNLVYEFLNVGGRKMSTSKGTGAAATEIAEVVPPEQLRLLFLRPRPNQAIDFDPDGTDAIPRLFDESDRLAAATAGREVRGELPPDAARLFAASLVDPTRRPGRRSRRGTACRSRTSPSSSRCPASTSPSGRRSRRARRSTPRRRTCWPSGRRGRARLARRRTRRTAAASPSSDELPAAAAALSDADRAFLAGLAERARCGDATWSGEAIQDAVFEAARTAELAPGTRLRRAVPRLPRPAVSGPRAGWLLASLDPRLRPASGSGPPPRPVPSPE